MVLYYCCMCPDKHGVCILFAEDVCVSACQVKNFPTFRYLLFPNSPPGLLWREQEAAVMYGSIDGGKTIGADPTFSELVSERETD